MASLGTYYRGRAWGILVTDPDADFDTTPCYLFFVSDTNRLRLDYVPGGDNNDGELEDHSGTPKVAFRLPAEDTRADDFLPAGNYRVHVHIGALTGLNNLGDKIADVQVANLEDGLPVQ